MKKTSDPRPPDLVESLRRNLPGRHRRRLARETRAAVLVPIVRDGQADRLILTRRTEQMPTHRGQVAFPGGFCTPGDRDPVAAALREADEEIGLDPAGVEVLGLLDDFPTRTGGVAVTPVVGFVDHMPRLEPQSGEVARIFTVTLGDLADASLWTSREVTGSGSSERICFFTHDDELLWGLSARIVLHMLKLTSAGSPVEPD